MDLMYKNKGAVSIFLVIVLVPMLVISSIFVDMSRINLAKSVAVSSGGLTLNTALTNYDAVLKDMYGLFASSQDTDELFENLENYYRQCIESAGVAEPEADDYVAQIMQFIKSETGTDDMLNMNLTSFEVTKPTGGSLANPAVLKSQIVEFMKYRGPINLGNGIFEALKSLKNLKKETELIDNKNKFYDQQTNILEKLESIWSELENYQYRDAYTKYEGEDCTFPHGNYLAQFCECMNDCVEELDMSIAYMVRYLYFAEGYNIGNSGVENFNVSFDGGTEIWKVKQTTTYRYEIEAEPDNVSINTLKADLKIAYAAIQAVKNQEGDIQKQFESKSNFSDTDKIKLVADFNTASEVSSYHTNIRNLVSALVQLQNSKNGCNPEEISKWYVIVDERSDRLSFTEDAQTNGGISLNSFIRDQLSHLSTNNRGSIPQYNELVSKIHNYWVETKKIVGEASKYVNNSLKKAKICAKAFDSFLTGKITKLDNALGILDSIFNELNNSESDYNKALTAWKNSANVLSEETIGDNDLREIARLENVLTVDAVNKLRTRIITAKTSLEDLKTQLAGFKIFGTELKELGGNPTYSKLKTLIPSEDKNDISNVTGYRKANESGQITATYNAKYDDVIKQLQGKIDRIEGWSISDNLKNSTNLTYEQVQLYTWLYNNFYNEKEVKNKFGTNNIFDPYTITSDTETTTSKKISDNKNKADIKQEEMEKKAEEFDGKGTPTGTVPEDRTYDVNFLPSGEWEETELKILESNSDTSTDEDKKNADKLLSSATDSLSMFDQVGELVGNMATTLRDDLYICNYIMNMFSYSTYEAEISVANGKETSAFESWYEFDESDGTYKLTSNFKSDPAHQQMLLDARTLTKVSINPNANHLYGSEVEYIIYGDHGVGKSYGTIYMIRFALNTVYAFTDAEINNITTTAATAMFGTPPLTPLIPVAKVAMTIGLALAESAYDLYQLKCGEEIPFIKNNRTWVMKPSNAVKVVIGEIAEEVVDVAIDEGMKVFNDVLDMTDEELEELINGTGEELNELAKTVVDNALDEVKNYANQAVQELVNICNNINLVAMQQEGYVRGKTTEKVEQVVVQLDAWLATQGPSETDVIYLAKKAAVDYIKDNQEVVIGQIFEKIGDVSTNVGNTAVEEIEKRATELETILNNVQENINGKVDALSEKAGNALNELRKNTVNELRTAATKGAESFRNKLKEQISMTFGTSNSKTKGTNAVASLLAWAYSDYLQLFLLVGIVASPESILLRTADIIELNMQRIDNTPGFVETTTETEVSRLWGLIKYTKTETKKEANADAFKLNKSYTYLNIKAMIEVKPMMLTLPLMADTVESQLTGTNWYQITYEGTMGY